MAEKLYYEVSLDASGVAEGASTITKSAAQAVTAMKSMGAAVKDLTTSSAGSPSWLSKNALSPEVAKSLRENIALYQQAAKLTQDLGKVNSSSGLDDMAGAAQRVGDAMKSMNSALEPTTMQDPKRIKALREQVALYERMAKLTQQMGTPLPAAKTGTGATAAALSGASEAAVIASMNKQTAIAENERASAIKNAANAAAAAYSVNQQHIRSLEGMRFAAQEVQRSLMLMTGGLAALSVATIGAAAKQERAFEDVARTAQVATDSGQMQLLADSYRRVSTEIKTTFEELSQIGSLGAQMDIPTAELEDFSTAVAKFTSITGTTVDETTTAFGRLFNTFQQSGVEHAMGADKYEVLASQIAELGAKSVSTEKEILVMAQSIAASAADAGMGQDAILAYSAALTSVGIKAEWARGSLQRIFGKINSAVAQGGDGLEMIAQQLGMTADEAESLWRTSPDEFFNKMLTSINNASDAVERWQMLQALGFTNTRDVQLLMRLSQNIGLVNKAFEDSAEAGSNTDFLNESVNRLSQTLIDTIARFRNSMANMMASFGEPFLAPIKMILNGLIELNNALATLGDSPVGRVFATLAGGAAMFVALNAGSKMLQASVLGVASSYVQMRDNLQRAGLSGELTWRNTISVITQANTALKQHNTLLAQKKAAEAVTATPTMARGVQTGAVTAETAAYTANTNAKKMAAAASLANASATGVSTAATGASIGVTTAAAGATTALGRAALGAAASFRAAMAGMGPAGWIMLAVSMIPTAIQLFDELANSEENAAARAEKAAAETLSAMGGSSSVMSALVQDTKDAAAGVQTGLTDLEMAVGGSTDAYGDASEASYYYVDASGAVVTATRSVAEEMGYASLKVGEHTKELLKNALESSEAFQGLTTTDFANLDEVGFDWGEFANKAYSGGEGAASSYVQGYIDTLTAQAAQIRAAHTTTSGEGNNMRTTWNAGSEDAKAEYDRLQGLIDSLNQAKGASQEAGGAFELAAAQGVAMGAAMGDTGDAADDLAGSLDGTGSAAQDAAQAWTDYRDALSGVVDAAFGFMDAEAAMYSSLDALNQSIYENGNAFNTMSEGGRANLEALQSYISDTVSYASYLAESMGYVGAEANEFVAAYVQDAIDALNAQGIDTSALDTQINSIYSSLGQTIQGPSLDTSVMDAQLAAAVQNASAAAQQIASIMGSVGIGTSITAGKVGRSSGSISRTATGVRGIASTLSKSARSTAAAASSAAAAARAAAQAARSGYQWAPKSSGGGGGGGGGGGSTPKSSGGGGGGGSSSKQGKTAEEIFEDFLNRLSKAMKNAIDKFWQQTDAQDAYHSSLNSLRKGVDDAKKSVKSLTSDIESLNAKLAEQEQTLRDAQFFNRVATKYGDQERVKSTQTDITKAQADISETKSSISEKKAEIKTIQAGMYALTGYTDEAIKNRKALKDLQSSMLELIESYAATGASTEQVAAYAQQLKGEFIAQATQIGFNEHEVYALSGAFDGLVMSIRAVPTTVDVNASDNGTAAATGGRISDAAVPRSAPVTAEPYTSNAAKELNYLTRDRTVTVTVSIRQLGSIIPKHAASGLLGGSSSRFAGGGLIPGGMVGNDSVDNLLAASRSGLYSVQSGEWVMPRSARRLYGDEFMKAVQNGTYRPSYGGGGTTVASFDPNQLSQLARAVSTVITMDGRAISGKVNSVNALDGRRGRN